MGQRHFAEVCSKTNQRGCHQMIHCNLLYALNTFTLGMYVKTCCAGDKIAHVLFYILCLSTSCSVDYCSLVMHVTVY